MKYSEITLKLEQINLNPKNPKVSLEDPRAKKEYLKLLKSLKNTGYNQRISVCEKDEGYMVIDGNHRVLAMREIGGFSDIKVHNYGVLSEKEIFSFISLNEDIKIPIDEVQIGEILKSFQDNGVSIQEIEEITPYSVDEIEQYVSMIEYDFEYKKELDEIPPQKETIQIHCADKNEKEIVQGALNFFKETTGKESYGEALIHIYEHYKT